MLFKQHFTTTLSENKVPELQKEIPNLPYEDHTPGNEGTVLSGNIAHIRHLMNPANKLVKFYIQKAALIKSR